MGGLAKTNKTKEKKTQKPQGFPRDFVTAGLHSHTAAYVTGILIAGVQLFRQVTLLSSLGTPASGVTLALFSARATDNSLHNLGQVELQVTHPSSPILPCLHGTFSTETRKLKGLHFRKPPFLLFLSKAPFTHAPYFTSHPSKPKNLCSHSTGEARKLIIL